MEGREGQVGLRCEAKWARSAKECALEVVGGHICLRCECWVGGIGVRIAVRVVD